MTGPEMFLNDRYRVLKAIDDFEGRYYDGLYTKLSQQDIAATLDISQAKVHRILMELIKAGYVEPELKRGRYKITEDGKIVLNQVNWPHNQNTEPEASKKVKPL